MKSSILKLLILLPFLTFILTSCKKDDANGSTPVPSSSAGNNLGKFNGTIQVSNDPPTNLGYIYNAKVKVTTNGSAATITIAGDEGFNREYTGKVLISSGTSSNMEITRQTKPVDKIAGGNLVISGNTLGFDISLANESVVVKASPPSTEIITIEGKIKMLGTDLLRE